MSTDASVRVFTFGFSPEFVIKPLASEGGSPEDVVVIIGGKPDNEYARKRIDDALRQVSAFLSMAGYNKYYYREVDTNKDFLEICRDIVGVLKEFSPMATRFRFYLTGGMRVLIIASLVVAKLLSISGRDVEVKLSREDLPIVYNVPLEILTLDAGSITEQRLEILRILAARGEATFEDLAIGRSPVTVRKLIDKMRVAGLVSYRARGRRQIYSVTPLGNIVLDIFG